MRILMLNYEYPPLGVGGSNACRYAEYKLMEKMMRIFSDMRFL